jgi:(2R)-sulfolactate sulfo-lyase subunit beta
VSDLPTIKITAIPLTAETMSEHIDVSGMLRFEYDLDGAADRTLKVMARTVNGRLACAETLRDDDFVLTKPYGRA